MQFAPRLTRPGGHLFHESVGEAVELLHLKLKVKTVGIEGERYNEVFKTYVPF